MLWPESIGLVVSARRVGDFACDKLSDVVVRTSGSIRRREPFRMRKTLRLDPA
jgi:hypothetical protein